MNKPSNIDILRITTISLSLDKLLGGQVQFMQQNGLEMATASFGKYNFENHYEINNLRRSINLYRDVLALIEIYLLIKKLKPKIVHTHTPKAGLLGIIAAFLAGVKVRIHTVAGLPLMEKRGFIKFILVQMERLTYLFATSVYPNSKGLLFYIKQNIWDTSKLKILGNGSSNGIDLDYFNIKNIAPLEIEGLQKKMGLAETTFLFVGRLVGDKGIVELVRAFLKIYSTNNNCSLILVGPLEPDLDPLPKDVLDVVNSHPAIISVGFQADVRPYIAVSDILVFPSYREGFPNVPMQCAAYKKALILSDINGCDEIVSDDSLGILVKTKSANLLENAMLKMLNDVDYRAFSGEKVYERISKGYDQQVIWKILLTNYKEALG